MRIVKNINLGLTASNVRELNRLVEKLDMNVNSICRRAIKELAQREGVSDGRRSSAPDRHGAGGEPRS